MQHKEKGDFLWFSVTNTPASDVFLCFATRFHWNIPHSPFFCSASHYICFVWGVWKRMRALGSKHTIIWYNLCSYNNYKWQLHNIEFPLKESWFWKLWWKIKRQKRTRDGLARKHANNDYHIDHMGYVFKVNSADTQRSIPVGYNEALCQYGECR